MESTAAKFEQVNDSLQTMLKRLLNELEVLQSAWKGKSGRSFEQVKIAWSQDQEKLQQALVQTASAIRTSGQTYTSTDDDASNKVASINTGVSLPL